MGDRVFRLQALTFFLSKPRCICYPEAIVRRLFLTICLWVFGLIALGARADAYKLTAGETLNGEVLPTSANDQGVQVKIGEGQYQRVPWANFSQDDLKNFAKNERMQPFVEPFIEITAAERAKKLKSTSSSHRGWNGRRASRYLELSFLPGWAFSCCLFSTRLTFMPAMKLRFSALSHP